MDLTYLGNDGMALPLKLCYLSIKPEEREPALRLLSEIITECSLTTSATYLPRYLATFGMSAADPPTDKDCSCRSSVSILPSRSWNRWVRLGRPGVSGTST